MKALVFERNLARFGAAAVAGRVRAGAGARVGPLSLQDVDEPTPPTSEWVRVRPRLAGICGSDLATVDGKSSRYFEPIVSFPFVPGHEVVGELDDGARVVIEPVLHCAIRGVEPVCDMCAAGRTNLCERVAFGHLEPGLQTGYCEDTGGGWSTAMVAHPLQLHAVPDDMTDEAAVMVEPTACAIHAAHSFFGTEVAVIGAGTLGLLTIAAVRKYVAPRVLIAAAKHPEQRWWAKELGADVVVDPGSLDRAVRTAVGSMRVGDRLTCGIDEVLDCVGSADSLQQALGLVAPGGTVSVVGMPGPVSLDLTGLWHREVAMRGVYAYGTESIEGNDRRTFDLAFELVRELDLGRLVTATYPLGRYREALDHAANAGARGAVKIAFDLTQEKRR